MSGMTGRMSNLSPHRSRLLLLTLLLAGCCHGRSSEDLTSAQQHARELYLENQQLQQLSQGLGAENQLLKSQLSETTGQLGTMNERLDNLASERAGLTEHLNRAMDATLTNRGTLTPELEAEGYQYDPISGLCRFHSNILFDLGSDLVRPEAQPVLKEFASSITSGAAAGMKVLIVGHTDDQNIARPETAVKHPTNWHLSTDRSDAVILELLRLGVEPERIAAMGYSEHHPLADGFSDTARQRNRRVELFVIPNDPSLAHWDPVSSVPQ